MRSYSVSVNGKLYEIEVKEFSLESALISVNGTPYALQVNQISAERPNTLLSSPRSISTGAGSARSLPSESSVATAQSSGTVVAPIPGSILQVLVRPGEYVKQGQGIFKIEAMKMENEIKSPAVGKVKEIRVKVGDAVSQGDILLLLE
jgi:biotin carboxyl carrier protein